MLTHVANHFNTHIHASNCFFQNKFQPIEIPIGKPRIELRYRTKEEMLVLQQRRKNLFYHAPTRRNKKERPTASHAVLKLIHGRSSKYDSCITKRASIGASLFDFGYDKDLGLEQVGKIVRRLKREGSIEYKQTRFNKKKGANDYEVTQLGEDDYWFSIQNNQGSVRLVEIEAPVDNRPKTYGDYQKLRADTPQVDQELRADLPEMTKNYAPNINININKRSNINIHTRGRLWITSPPPEEVQTPPPHICLHKVDHIHTGSGLDTSCTIPLEEKNMKTYKHRDNMTLEENKVIESILKRTDCYQIDEDDLIYEILLARYEYRSVGLPVNDFEHLALAVQNRLVKTKGELQ